MNLETFFEKFDLFADAPDAIESLHEVVLQLAVSGKLVPQLGVDAPVNLELLETQTTPRKQAEGRSGASLEALTEDEIPAEIPDSWAWVRLFRLCEPDAPIVYGILQPGPDVRPNGVPYVRPTEIKDDRIRLSEIRHTSPEIAAQYARATIRKGDVLLTIVGTLGATAIVPEELDGGNITQSSCRLRPDSRFIDTSYLLICLRSRTLFRQYRGFSLGSAVQRLNIAHVRALAIPVPPLAEQKRIVAKVDELMALCDRMEVQQQERETRHAALARASLARFADAPTPANLNFIFHKSYDITPADLRKTIYQAAFDGVFTSPRRLTTSPTDLPTGWVLRDIASLCVIEDGDRGSAYPKKEDFFESGYCVFLNTKNVRPHGFDLTTLEWISKEKHVQLRKGTLVRGDVVFTSRGTIGNIAHYDEAIPYDVMRINSGMFILRGFQKYMEASFLSRLLRSPQIRSQIDSLQSGSAQPQLPIREFRKFTAKIPPLAEQRRIVAKVDELIALVDTLEAQLVTARTTAEKLMEAVVAELTAQEPSRTTGCHRLSLSPELV